MATTIAQLHFNFCDGHPEHIVCFEHTTDNPCEDAVMVLNLGQHALCNAPAAKHISQWLGVVMYIFPVSPPVTGAVGGEILSYDMTSLFLAGAMTNAFWIFPTFAMLTGAAVATAIRIRRRKISR